MKPPYQILGIGTPIIDYLIPVSDDFLDKLPGIRGGSMPVDHDTFKNLIHQSNGILTKAIGGGTTNTIKGLASLGHSCALFGIVGEDPTGNFFRKEIEKLNITPYLLSSPYPTAQVACFISPDSDRTMRSYFSDGSKIKPEQLLNDFFKGVQIVHIEGYLLTNEKLVLKAMELAHQAGAKISFDLSSVEIALTYNDELFGLISTYIDILFANEHEAFALTGKHPEQSCKQLKSLCDVVIIKMGERGNLAAASEEMIYQPALNVNTVDTTGAGDLFASGFLYGYLSQKNLQECSRYGAVVASEVVQVIGADIPPNTWKNIIQNL